MLALAMAMLMQSATPDPAHAVTDPDWQRLPSAQDIGKYYPKPAMKEDLAGRVTLSCNVTAEGRLIDCKAERVWPEGAGFGEAAVAMSEVFRMRPKTKDGRAVAGGTVKIPMMFLLPADLRAGAVPARHPQVKGEIVELDCRFRDLKLDNCFTRGAATEKAVEVAMQAAEAIRLPGLPTKRRQGRVVVPLVFADSSGLISPPELVTRPIWRNRPTANQVYRAYPAAARPKGSVGNVMVECRIAAGGALDACATIAEDPASEGFGAAVLKLMPLFKMDAVDVYGLKVEGRKIRIPIRISPTPPPTNGD